MTDQLVRIEREGAIAELVLNRPGRRNALVGPMIEELTAAVREISADDAIQVVLFRGEGGAFCSGHDLSELQADPRPEWAGSLARIFRAANLALFECPKPIVGALERFAINAGAALALSCDLLVAGDSAFLQVGEIQQGAGIANNAAWLRLRAGEAVASRMALLGERVPASDLFRLGLACEVVADDAVVARARAIASRIASFPLGSPSRVKADIRAQARVGTATEWFREQSSQALLSAGRVS